MRENLAAREKSREEKKNSKKLTAESSSSYSRTSTSSSTSASISTTLTTAADQPNLYTRCVIKSQKVVRGFLGRVKYKQRLKKELEEADLYWSEGTKLRIMIELYRAN